MNISRAAKKDMVKILRLQKCAFISEAELYNDYSIPPLTQGIEEIKQDFANKVFLKVEEKRLCRNHSFYEIKLCKGTIP